MIVEPMALVVAAPVVLAAPGLAQQPIQHADTLVRRRVELTVLDRGGQPLGTFAEARERIQTIRNLRQVGNDPEDELPEAQPSSRTPSPGPVLRGSRRAIT